uniref:SKP1 component dimerisation domain-containing protein n=1 Tax=Entomoneis paludosa TaxID=265537 RepID=A0A7S2YAT4_9STRA
MTETTTANTIESDQKDMVTLVSLDDHKFTLPVAAAGLSEMVGNALGLGDDEDEDEDDEDDDGDNADKPTGKTVELLKVTSRCLEKVVQFMEHHHQEKMNDIPMPLPGNNFEECMTQEWYREFVREMDRDMIFEILGAANYMNIKPLLDLACLRVTFELTGKSAEEIRVYLNLPELTAEEEAKAREEHAWIFEESNN